jgi:mannose-1-phosphate guanylyltransferase
MAIERILVNTHYLAEQVVAFVKESEGADRVDLVFEPTLLGTGGTLLKNKEWIGHKPVLVAHADNLTLFNISDFMVTHQQRPTDCSITMMTFDTDEPQTCGIVEEIDQVVVRFHEKVSNPPGSRANAAVYIFEPDVIDFIESIGTERVDISTQVLPHYLGRIATYHNSVYHRDIGTLKSLEIAHRELPGLSDLGV